MTAANEASTPSPTSPRTDAEQEEEELSTSNKLVPVYGSPTLVILTAIEFGEGSDELTPESAATLDAIIEIFELYPGIIVEARGHADPRTEAAKAIVLSTERARTVQRALIAAGAPAERVDAIQCGASQPRENLSSRRVEFKLRGTLPDGALPTTPLPDVCQRLGVDPAPTSPDEDNSPNRRPG